MNAPITQPPENQVIGVAPFGVDGAYLLESTPMQKKVITGIYAIINPLGQTYIGQAIDWGKRQARYKRYACERQPKIYQSLKLFGVEAHVFTLLTECNADLLDDFEFSYKQDFIDENGWEKALFCRIDDRKRDGISTSVACSQYTKKGEWVADFASQAEAERATGVHYQSISAALYNKRKTAGGFLWGLQGADAPVFKPRTKYRATPVAAYNADNQLVRVYSTLKEAAEDLGLKPSNISNALGGRSKTSGGLKWKKLNN